MTENNFYFKKNVLITGGTKGIGLATVKKFIKLNANIIYTYTQEDKSYFLLKELEKEHKNKIKGIRHNSTDYSKNKSFLKKIEKHFKKLDFLINNVGGPIKRSKFLKSNNQLWLDTLNLNLITTVNCINLVYHLLKKSKFSTIINVSSISAKTGGGGDSLHYSVSKSAINSLTYGLAKELSPTRVLSVAPSAIDTQFQKKFSSIKRINSIIKDTPAKRIGSPEEVANLISILCNHNIGYLSGETIFLTGGR